MACIVGLHANDLSRTFALLRSERDNISTNCAERETRTIAHCLSPRLFPNRLMLAQSLTSFYFDTCDKVFMTSALTAAQTARNSGAQ
jgi:hypothetical protein